VNGPQAPHWDSGELLEGPAATIALPHQTHDDHGGDEDGWDDDHGGNEDGDLDDHRSHSPGS